MTSQPITSVFPDESDSMLIAATKNGESQAFGFLMKRHEAKAFAHAFRITRNREDAQDVVQESFHKAFVHLDSFQAKSSFSTWFTRIVINEGLMCLRRNRARGGISLDDVRPEFEGMFPPEIPDKRKSPVEIYEQLENERILFEAIHLLHEKLRTVVCLRMEERTVKEAAEMLGLGIGTLKARLFRARQKLRVNLTRAAEFRRGRATAKSRQGRGTSQGSRATGSKARVEAAVGWRNTSPERTLQGTASRMLEVA